MDSFMENYFVRRTLLKLRKVIANASWCQRSLPSLFKYFLDTRFGLWRIGRRFARERVQATLAVRKLRTNSGHCRGVAKPAWLLLRKSRHRDQDAVFCHLDGLLRIEMRERHTPTFCFIIAVTRPHLLAAFGDPSQSPACILH
jgi:hypothetical protein